MARRGPKLLSSTVTAALDWKPNDDFWISVEKRTGPLASEQRDALAQIVATYVRQAQFEANATPRADAIKRLKEVEAAAECFWQVIVGGNSTVSRDALHAVEAAIEDGIEFHASESKRYTYSRLVEQMTTFMEACNFARREFADIDGEHYQPFQAWAGEFVPGLAAFWESLGQTATARKDASSRAHFTPSKFVSFVADVQSHIPEAHRKLASDDTLSSAVWSALSKWKAGFKEPDDGPQ